MKPLEPHTTAKLKLTHETIANLSVKTNVKTGDFNTVSCVGSNPCGSGHVGCRTVKVG